MRAMAEEDVVQDDYATCNTDDSQPPIVESIRIRIVKTRLYLLISSTYISENLHNILNRYFCITLFDLRFRFRVNRIRILRI